MIKQFLIKHRSLLKRLFLMTLMISQNIIDYPAYPESGRDGGAPLVVRDFAAFPREQSLGGSTIAIDNNVSVIGLNPAAFVSDQSQVILASKKLHTDDEIYHLAYGLPLPPLSSGRRQYLGVMVTRLESGGIYATDGAGNITGSAAMQESMAVLTYAIGLGSDYYLGVGLNYYSQKLYRYNDSVFDFSAGISGYINADPRKRFGVSVRNLAESSLRVNQVPEKIPRDISGGVAFDFGYNENADNMTASVAYTYNRLDSYYGAGIEYRMFHDMITLRAGVEQGIFSGGFGIRYRNLSFDFGYQDLPGATGGGALRDNFLSASATITFGDAKSPRVYSNIREKDQRLAARP